MRELTLDQFALRAGLDGSNLDIMIGAAVKAFYTFRENRELATLSWHGLESSDSMRGGFETFVAGLQAEVFGEIRGTVRVATGSPYEPSIDSCSIAELALHWRGDHWLVDAKLELQPTVEAHDSILDLVEISEDEWPLGEVPLRRSGKRWSIIGRPPKVRDESLLFIDVDFDPPGEGGVMVAWFRSKTDLWLARGLDGEPTGPDQRANRDLLISALTDIAAKTAGTLELRELARSPDA